MALPCPISSTREFGNAFHTLTLRSKVRCLLACRATFAGQRFPTFFIFPGFQRCRGSFPQYPGTYAQQKTCKVVKAQHDDAVSLDSNTQ